MIPERGRKRALIKLNEAHPGAVRMKKFARGYMWCLEIDGSIEQCVKGNMETFNATIELVHESFTALGFPEVIVSDKATAFTSR